jgi:hypothetical protein
VRLTRATDADGISLLLFASLPGPEARSLLARRGVGAFVVSGLAGGFGLLREAACKLWGPVLVEVVGGYSVVGLPLGREGGGDGAGSSTAGGGSSTAGGGGGGGSGAAGGASSGGAARESIVTGIFKVTQGASECRLMPCQHLSLHIWGPPRQALSCACERQQPLPASARRAAEPKASAAAGLQPLNRHSSSPSHRLRLASPPPRRSTWAGGLKPASLQ